MTMMQFRAKGHDASTLQCTVVIPADLRDAAQRAQFDVDGRPAPFLPDFLADDIVSHVAASFRYRVDKVYANQWPPANFARDLEGVLAADLMVFDLSGANPEVCFAAGLRYMTARPMVCFVGAGQAVPHSLAHVRPIPYARDRLRESEAELTRRLKLIGDRDWVEGRPFFEVLAPDAHRVRIGDFDISRDVLADIEDRIHGDGSSRSQPRVASLRKRSTRYGN